MRLKKMNTNVAEAANRARWPRWSPSLVGFFFKVGWLAPMYQLQDLRLVNLSAIDDPEKWLQLMGKRHGASCSDGWTRRTQNPGLT